MRDTKPDPLDAAYKELMGQDDEMNTFFLLTDRDPQATSFRVLRVVGLPERGEAWVN